MVRAPSPPKPCSREARRRPAVACLLGLALAACAEHRAAGPPPSQSTARPAGSAGAPALAAAAPGEPAPVVDGAWVEAVRLERWAEAAERIDALPLEQRALPSMKYVRARVAFELGDHAKTVELLHGLEQALPLLAREAARYRAEAAFEAGPFLVAAAYFEASSGARDLARAAIAYMKGGDPKQARALADRAVVAAQRAKRSRDEAAARMARARIQLGAAVQPAEKGGAAAAASALALPDLRWIVKNAPSSPEGREAATLLAAMPAQLSHEERLQNVDAMVATGSAAEAIAELDKLSSTSGAPGAAVASGAKRAPGVSASELHHRRATALYRARDYEGAVQAFLKGAATPSARQAEQLHLAARSLSRLRREGEAIERHLAVARRFRKTRWGELSSLLAARLLMQVGRYPESVAQYGRFLAAYPRSEERDDAVYERALAMLSTGGAAGARKVLEQRARGERAPEAARLRELAGLAALRGGDREGAVRIWTQVMRDQPLSWGALLARSRLAAAGAPTPPLLVPASLRDAPPLDVKLPPAAALLSSMGLDGDAESYLAENERDAAAAYAGQESEALCRMYGMLSPAKRRYRVGTQAISAAALERAPSQADRWAWECVYPAPYLGEVRALEAQHGLPRGLVHALMRQESAFDPVVVSPASAVGLMQLMPATALKAASELSLGFDLGQLKSAPVNLRLGGYYIGKLLRTFEGSLPLATAAYNAGPKAVSHWLEGGIDRDTDVWVARIPYEETRTYVGRVLSNLARYQWLDGGDAAVAQVPLVLPADARAPADAY
ncbi:exported transglycosylase [Sorangium cellulosum]|uniref:Exported transglycosylase n=1 Tax=Sorangium cellulosum TaxID=56 RepID=A0A2L0F365_SORCE|nr:transglycosylase SLT domain-containing protein [Sorangium cellulosum]AUX45977.1 exported transglycosylase [Sorangium cellulosum]